MTALNLFQHVIVIVIVAMTDVICYLSHRTDAPGLHQFVFKYEFGLGPTPMLAEFFRDSCFQLEPPTVAELAAAEKQHAALSVRDVLESVTIDITCDELLPPEGLRH